MRRVLLVIFIATCAAFPGGAKAFRLAMAPKPGDSLLYLYRAPSSQRTLQAADFYLDGVKIAALTDRTYTWLYVPAGAHALLQRWDFTLPFLGQKAQPVQFESGETYFYRVDTTISIDPWSGGVDANSSVAQPNASEAASELAAYKYLAPLNVDAAWRLSPAHK